MKRLVLAAVAAAALTLSACETATPYQPLGARGTHASGGYADQQIETNRWTVSFVGNDSTPRPTVERYLLFRSADLTIRQGYDWFTTVDRNTERKSDYYSFGNGYGPGFGYGGFGGYGFGGGYGRYGRGFGYGGFGGGYGGFGYGFGGFGYNDLEQVNRYTASAEILMGRGPKPLNDRHAFTARSVVDHLQATIAYPGQPQHG